MIPVTRGTHVVRSQPRAAQQLIAADSPHSVVFIESCVSGSPLNSGVGRLRCILKTRQIMKPFLVVSMLIAVAFSNAIGQTKNPKPERELLKLQREWLDAYQTHD